MGMGMTYVDTSNLAPKAVASTARRMTAYLRPYTRRLVPAAASLVIASLLNLGPPWATKIAVDDFIAQRDFGGILRIVAVLVVIYIARAVFGYLNFFLFARISQRVIYDIGRDMFRRLVRHSMGFFESQRTGETVSRLTSDVQALQQALQGQVLNALFGLFTMVIYLVVMLTLEWRLTLIILSVVPIMLLASVVSARMLRVRYRRVQETVANINTAIEENVSGVRVSRAFVREEADAQRFQGENRANLRANLGTTMVESVTTPLIEGLSGITVAVILAYGGWQITQGEMTIGTLIAFLAYLQIFHQPLTEIVRVNYVVQSGLAASDRIFQFMDVPRDIDDPPNAIRLDELRGQVEFDHVSFSYDGATDVLRDISFKIEPGQTVALVGHTGSGKTSLVNLLARFYDPTAGQVRVDGHDLRHVGLAGLRAHTAYVLQETYLFTGSIADNLRYGDPQASDAALRHAAGVAGADAFIGALPDEYDTCVGEGGMQLSRGQQQRVALARAILANPRILVLDEATSDIDTESEWQIQQALETVMLGRTSFVIAHRLSTIRRADLILVLNEGRLVQRGTHAELITQPGHYRELHEAQFEDTPERQAGSTDRSNS